MRAWLEPRPLKRRSLWLAGGWLLVAAVVTLSLWPQLPHVDIGFEHLDKLEHTLAYAALMAWFGFLYQKRSHAVLFVLVDLAANTLGVTAGLLLTRALFFRQ